MQKKENPHTEHRQRVRKEFLENGFSDVTPPHKILELLLFYSIPRRDTNEIAHALLNRFGSLTGVLEAGTKDLMTVKDVGESSAVLLKLMLPLFSRYRGEGIQKGITFKTMNDICDYIKAKYIGFTKEIFAVTSFNIRGEIVAFDTLNSGDISFVGLSTRSLIEKVLERNAAAVVISHNHPQGHAIPSPEDEEMTKRISALLSTMSIRLLDHIIVSNEDNDCVSMAQTAKYQSIFQ